MYELALFAGAGGGILGGTILGWRCVGAVEIEPYARRVLLERQRDGVLERFPIWDDIRTFKTDNIGCRDYFEFLRGIRSQLVITGGFPCQDISTAGAGAGIKGNRSGLWFEMSRVICEIRPRFIYVENSPALLVRGIESVLGELAALGYDAEWGVLGAAFCGAPHRRERIWVYAHAHGERPQALPNEIRLRQQTNYVRCAGRFSEMGGSEIWPGPCPAGARPMGVGNGVAGELDRIKAAGNGQVPIVAATAWNILSGSLE